MQRQLIYICGPGHSGSTLLDMILGAHPAVSSLGEIHRLYLSANRTSREHRCGCGQPVAACPFWEQVAREVASLLGDEPDPGLLSRLVTTDPRYLELRGDGTYLGSDAAGRRANWVPSLNRAAMVVGSRRLWSVLARLSPAVRVQRQAIRNSLTLFEAVRRVAGTPVVVDATKNPARLKGLYLERDAPMRVLYVIRDGRAVCCSRMQREGRTMADSARRWLAEHRKQRLTQLSMDRSIVRRVRYEELCRAPDDELARICRFLDLEPQPAMLAFRSAESHRIGGNPMRFQGDDEVIRLDEKWRSLLSRDDLDEFERVAGGMNRALGYAA